MNKKITDIKKVSSKKHVDVDDQTKEVDIDVHKIQEKLDDTKKSDFSKEEKYIKHSIKEAVIEKNDPDKDIDLSKMRITFMGTGEFAHIILKHIRQNAPGTIVQIITQADKKIGRKKSSIHRTLAPNPVRDFAKEHNIPLFQPRKLDSEAIEKIRDIKPGIIVVASYGQILPEEILKIPKFGPLNIHGSLLPELRGASPVQNAILLGKKETGVTIMKMDEGLDTGPIIGQKKIEILEHEKSDELLQKVAKFGAELLLEVGPKYVLGEISPIPQDNSKATLCQLIDREDGHIQWTQTTQEIYNRFRALHPWPGVFSYWEKKENQLLRLKLRALYPCSKELTEKQENLLPGTVFIAHDQLSVKTFDGAIIIEAIQPECKAVMPIYDFLNGHKDFEGAMLK
jgi:methionyl-tRNA formyltransferase